MNIPEERVPQLGKPSLELTLCYLLLKDKTDIKWLIPNVFLFRTVKQPQDTENLIRGTVGRTHLAFPFQPFSPLKTTHTVFLSVQQKDMGSFLSYLHCGCKRKSIKQQHHIHSTTAFY